MIGFNSLTRLIRGVPKVTRFRQFSQSRVLNESVFEPDYLDQKASEIPNHELLNVQVKGYDFPVLEKYAKYIHKTAERLGITVEDTWAFPCEKFRITKLKPESSLIANEYLLNIYERNVQISDVPSTKLPLLINIVESALPAGVTLRVHPHIPEYTESRFVPDLELKELKEQLSEMRGPEKEDSKK